MSLWITRWARNGGLVLQNAAVSLRAKAPAKAPAAPAEPAAGEGEAAEEKYKAGTPILGVNFMKDGKDPVYMEEDKYPAWLFDLVELPKTYEQLNAKFEEVGAENMGDAEYQRMLRLENRKRIKYGNLLRAKD